MKRMIWTKEEDDFLAEQRRMGLTKREVAAAYYAHFPGYQRPINGILTRIPSHDRAHGIDPSDIDAIEHEHIEAEQPTVGDAVRKIYDLVASFDEKDAARILKAVRILYSR